MLFDDPKKAERALSLMREGGTIIVQVLNETANVGRKLKMSWEEVNGVSPSF